MEFLEEASRRMSVEVLVEGAAEWMQIWAICIPFFQDGSIIAGSGAQVNALALTLHDHPESSQLPGW